MRYAERIHLQVTPLSYYDSSITKCTYSHCSIQRKATGTNQYAKHE